MTSPRRILPFFGDFNEILPKMVKYRNMVKGFQLRGGVRKWYTGTSSKSKTF